MLCCAVLCCVVLCFVCLFVFEAVGHGALLKLEAGGGEGLTLRGSTPIDNTHDDWNTEGAWSSSYGGYPGGKGVRRKILYGVAQSRP